MSGVLFVCTGNSCRSQMAEAFARRLLPPDVRTASAGTNPVPIHPRAVEAMRAAGVELAGQRPKSLAEVALAQFDVVVTLCDDAAARCPEIDGARRLHWPIPDPARATGTDVEVAAAFRAARDEVRARVLALGDELAPEPAVGVIGGSGFYDLPGMATPTAVTVDTPFGAPSDALLVGRYEGRRVVFLARHGRGHTLLPSEVNARANVYALKRLGVTTLLSVSAVGSLRDGIAPGEVVTPRQFLDRTSGRAGTFFGQGVVAHVSLADPVCGRVAEAIGAGARAEGATVHPTGTYACVEGPQFSCRAESELLRTWGADVVGMTNLPEARLAREAEICYATLALPTDYDCWRSRTAEVRVADVIAVLQANVIKARRILACVLGGLDPRATCACRTCLDTALFTPPAAIDAAARLRLQPILARRLGGEREERETAA